MPEFLSFGRTSDVTTRCSHFDKCVSNFRPRQRCRQRKRPPGAAARRLLDGAPSGTQEETLALGRHGASAAWRRGGVAAWRRGGVAAWRRGGAAARRRGGAAARRPGNSRRKGSHEKLGRRGIAHDTRRTTTFPAWIRAGPRLSTHADHDVFISSKREQRAQAGRSAGAPRLKSPGSSTNCRRASPNLGSDGPCHAPCRRNGRPLERAPTVHRCSGHWR